MYYKYSYVIIQEEFTRQGINNSAFLTILEDLSPFDGLETQYLQRQYFKQTFNLLVRNDVE